VVPAIIGQSVGLPPLVVMIALGAGAELGGVTGMFLSMPVAAVLRVIVKFYVSRLEQAEEENSSASAEKFQLQEQEDMTLGKANGA
jgi:predicted PurR-regulated permease PerM